MKKRILIPTLAALLLAAGVVSTAVWYYRQDGLFRPYDHAARTAYADLAQVISGLCADEKYADCAATVALNNSNAAALRRTAEAAVAERNAFLAHHAFFGRWAGASQLCITALPAGGLTLSDPCPRRTALP